jgi:hypothetical protein
MTLAIDIRASLDLSGVVGSARAGLLDHLGGDPVLRALVDGDATALISGDLGSILDALGSGDLSTAETLFAPLGRALQSLLGELNLGPLGELGALTDAIDLVRSLAERIAALVSSDIDPLSLGAELGGSLNDVVSLVLDRLDLPRQLAPVADLRAAISAIDGLIVSDDPAVLVEALAPVLLPVPVPSLRLLADHLDLFDERLGRLPVHADLTAALDGWSVALDTLAEATVPGPALAAVASARARVQAALDAGIAATAAAFDGLGCGRWTAELRRMLGTLPSIPSVSIDRITATFAADIDEVRVRLAATTSDAVAAGLNRIRTEAEALLDATIGVVPDALDEAEARLAQLLSRLPTATFRAQLQSAVNDLVDRIDSLGIDAVPRAIDEALRHVRDVIEGDVVGGVQAAAAEVVGRVEEAIATVEDLLGDVDAALSEAVDGVSTVLIRIRDALAGFRTEVEAVATLRAEIDLSGGAQRTVENVDQLAAAVAELLGGGALPDALRPVLDQAAGALEGLDLSGMIAEPASSAIAELDVQVPAELEDLLADTAALLRDATPLNVIAELDGPILEVAGALERFDPASLLSGLSSALDQAAAAVTALDPRPHVGPLQQPFDAVLEQLDRLDPSRLLAPLAAGFDQLLGVFGNLNAEAVGDRVLAGVEAAGAPMQEAFATAARRIGTESTPPPAGTATAPDPPLAPTPAADRPPPPFMPGDGIRALGVVLDRIRIALEPLDDAVLVPAFRELHRLTAGLAERAVPETVTARLGAAVDATLPVLRLDVRVPAAARLRLSWDRAAARHQLDVTTSPVTLFSTRQPAVADLNARAKGCIADVGAAGASLSAFVGSIRAAIPRALATEPDGRGPIAAFLAQLDPEPIAAALDALAVEAMTLIFDAAASVEPLLDSLRAELEARLAELGPDRIIERATRLLLLLRAEIDRLNPREIALAIRPVFFAVRNRIAAWSPAALTEGVAATLDAIGAAIRALDPAELLGDLSSLDGLAARVAALAPGRRLRPLADRLGEVGAELAAIDLEATVEIITGAAADVVLELGEAVDIVLAGLAELLRTLGSSATLSVSIQAEVSVR